MTPLHACYWKYAYLAPYFAPQQYGHTYIIKTLHSHNWTYMTVMTSHFTDAACASNMDGVCAQRKCEQDCTLHATWINWSRPSIVTWPPESIRDCWPSRAGRLHTPIHQLFSEMSRSFGSSSKFIQGHTYIVSSIYRRLYLINKCRFLRDIVWFGLVWFVLGLVWVGTLHKYVWNHWELVTV